MNKGDGDSLLLLASVLMTAVRNMLQAKAAKSAIVAGEETER
jgi:hypothetical protein